MNALPPAIFIMGPTAAGKTALAMYLYDHLPCELISVDSALIYRGMDIGTAKPTSVELARYPHHLIDILEPNEAYSAARFCEDALAAMADISRRGRIPVLVGGTMMYFRALQFGLAQLPDADPVVRAKLEAEAKQLGWPQMHQRLAEVDPAAAARIKPTDPQRIQRALEVFEISGRTMTELHAEQAKYALPYQVTKLIIAPQQRARLHARIEQRFRLMLEQGFVAEVEGLRARGDLDLDCPSMRSVGYRQVWQYLDGEYDYETMVHKGIVATRQFAKRQFTWLRAEENVHWLESEDAEVMHRAMNILKKIL